MEIYTKQQIIDLLEYADFDIKQFDTDEDILVSYAIESETPQGEKTTKRYLNKFVKREDSRYDFVKCGEINE